MSYPGYPAAGNTGYPQQPGMPQPGMPQPGGQEYPQGVGFQGGQPGYPPQGQPGYPPQGQPGYPPQGQPGYPPQGQPGYPSQGMPGAQQPQGIYPGQIPQSSFPCATPAPGNYPGAPPTQAGYLGAIPAQSSYPGAPPGQSGYPGAPPAQSGYPGAPPAQSGYPGAPPAQSGYPGAPPAQSGYPGAPPAQSGYPGAPPAQSGYPSAAPTRGTYPGAPSTQGGYSNVPQTQGGYPGAPQAQAPYQQNTGLPPSDPAYQSYNKSGVQKGAGYQGSTKVQTQGTIVPTPQFNAEADATALRKAMKGFGTDESTIINILANRTLNERLQIRQLFKTMIGKDLIKELKSELSGKLENLVVAMLTPADEFTASELNKAIKGLGTDESDLIEIMCSKTNVEIERVKETYKKIYGNKLESDLTSDTSGHFKRLMVSLCAAGRQENQILDQAKAESDAQMLYAAGEQKLGTDESKFNYILCSQSFGQLNLVFEAYQRIAGKSLENSVSSEMSGYIEKGILSIIKMARDPSAYYAEKVYQTMKGMGTKDRDLIRIIVCRSEIDMVQIKYQFQVRYSKSLEQFIKDDTSGDYGKMLRAIIT